MIVVAVPCETSAKFHVIDGVGLSAGARTVYPRTVRFTIRKAKLPKAQVGCLAPGSRKLNRGC